MVICNCASGTGGDDSPARALTVAFADRGVAAQVVEVRPGMDLGEEVRRALAGKPEVVVAAGGDGTINAIAGALADTGVPMGVLPMGTLNHFAKDVGVPLTLPEAVETVLHGSTQAIDLGEVNGQVFVNNSSIGLYPHLVRRREAHQRLGRRKWSAFVRAFWTVLGRYPFLRIRLETDEQSFVRKTPMVFVGNNEYEVHGLKLGTRKRLDAGTLAIYLPRAVGRFKLFWFCVRALFGRLRDHEDFEILTSRSLSIATRHNKSIQVATDGEVARMDLPLDYRIRPGALLARVPATTARA